MEHKIVTHVEGGKARDLSVDIAKGLCMMMVVLMHCFIICRKLMPMICWLLPLEQCICRVSSSFQVFLLIMNLSLDSL